MFDKSLIEKERTIYERVLGSEEDPPSKWRSKILPEGRLFYTGRTIHALESQDGMRWFGVSKCNPIDAFDKPEGQRRARDRAFGAFQRYVHNSRKGLGDWRGLELVTFVNYHNEAMEGYMLGTL